MNVPRWTHVIRLRVRSVFQSSRVEAELDEELQFHLEQQIEHEVARGRSPAEARRQAMLSLGGLAGQKDACRDVRGVWWIEHAIRDARYAARMLRRSPGFALVAILSLALGIGANTAIFQLIDAIRLQPLPVPRAGELATIEIAGGNGGFGITEDANARLTFPLWEEIRAAQRAFSGVFAWGTVPLLVGNGPDAQVVRGMWVSGSAFPVLGLAPAMGRLFNPIDDRRGCAPAAVLDYAFWQARFGGDPSAIGGTVTILNRRVPIIGVAPPSFSGFDVGTRFDLALPICAAASWGSPLDRRDWFWLTVMGRLNGGWSVQRAAEHLDALSGGIMAATLPTGRSAASLERYRRFKLTARSAANGVSALRSAYGDALWILLALTGLVLLMACTNLTNLLLARAGARAREIAVRLAIGASRGRVAAQLFVESLLLAACGLALGLVIAAPISRALVALLTTEHAPLHLDLRPDRTVFVFAAAVGALTCLLFGLIPTYRASRIEPGTAMKTDGRGLSSTSERSLVQRTLIVAQVTLSLVLIFEAALFVRSFRTLTEVDTGVQGQGLLFVRVADLAGAPAPGRIITAQNELLERIRAVPQVASAATTTKFPLDPSSWTMTLVVPTSTGADRRSSKFTYVSPRYFNTVGMRLLAGRDFDDADDGSSRGVAIVNQTFVRRYLAERNPVGAAFRTVGEPGYPPTEFAIVGVVSDTKYSSLREAPPPIAFVPIAQHPSLRPWPNIVVRTSAPAAVAIGAVKQAVAELHPGMTTGFAQFDVEVRQSLLRERLLAWLASALGVLAGLLALSGVYGVMAFMVARRRREIAIRLALGAGRARVVALIGRETGLLVSVGLALGSGLAIIGVRGVGNLLYGLSPSDPATLGEAMAAVAAIAVLGCALPARRASRLDATTVLRTD